MLGDFVAVLFKCEVSSIEQMQFSVRIVASVCLRTFFGEKRIIFSPDHKHLWLVLTEVCLPLRVQLHVVLVIEE